MSCQISWWMQVLIGLGVIVVFLMAIFRMSDTYRRDMPEWFPSQKIVGPAEDGGFLLRVSNMSVEAKRLLAEGWRINTSGRYHILARKSDA